MTENEQKEENKQFWLVWRDPGGAPTKRHYNFAEACAEAERLTIRYKVKFFVCEAQVEFKPVDEAEKVTLTKNE